MEKINIVFSSDNNYAPHLGVALCSIFENRKSPNPIEIYILDGGIDLSNLKKLNYLIKKYESKINFIKINKSKFENFPVKNYITHAAYYRIMIPDLLPDINKVLYLDCDLVVIGDLYEFYCLNINNYLCGAVDEQPNNFKHPIEQLKRLKIPINKRYFNSGVLLINLDKWRKQNISNELIKFIKNNEINFITNYFNYHDQDALNAVLWDSWFHVPEKYNYMEDVFLNKPFVNINKEIIKNDIRVLHFIGRRKPWNYLSINKINKYYFYYLKKTPWKDEVKITNINFVNIVIKKPILKIIKFFKKIIIYFFSYSVLEYIFKIKRKFKIKFF